jgi:hypothetical protein
LRYRVVSGISVDVVNAENADPLKSTQRTTVIRLLIKPVVKRHGRRGSSIYFTFALAFRRSAQYVFMRALTAFRAAADI